MLIRALEPLDGPRRDARAPRPRAGRRPLLGPRQAHPGARHRARLQRHRPGDRTGPVRDGRAPAGRTSRWSSAGASASPRRPTCRGASARPARDSVSRPRPPALRASAERLRRRRRRDLAAALGRRRLGGRRRRGGLLRRRLGGLLGRRLLRGRLRLGSGCAGCESAAGGAPPPSIVPPSVTAAASGVSVSAGALPGGTSGAVSGLSFLTQLHVDERLDERLEDPGRIRAARHRIALELGLHRLEAVRIADPDRDRVLRRPADEPGVAVALGRAGLAGDRDPGRRTRGSRCRTSRRSARIDSTVFGDPRLDRLARAHAVRRASCRPAPSSGSKSSPLPLPIASTPTGPGTGVALRSSGSPGLIVP